jgi:hypothetical protein
MPNQEVHSDYFENPFSFDSAISAYTVLFRDLPRRNGLASDMAARFAARPPT